MAVLNFDIKTVKLPSGEEAKAVFLTGSIDATTNQTFEGRLSDILNAGTRNAMLVLTNVKYINSTGLGTIVKCVDSFREKGGDIKLVGVPAKVIALFEMLGLLALFETHETIEAAVASVGKAKAAEAKAAPTGDPEVHVGEIYWVNGQADRAVAAYQAAIKKGVKDKDEAQLRLGVVYLGQNKRPQANDAFKAITPTSPWAQLARLWTLYGAQKQS